VDVERTIGAFEAKIDRLEKDVAALVAKQDEMLTILHQARGGWKVMVMVGGAAAALTLFLTKVLAWVWSLPR
jgi:hypothetical protein